MSPAAGRSLSSVLPEPGPQRTFAIATLVNTVGKGAFMTVGVLYFIRAVHLPADQVGVGLSAAGFVAVLVGIVVGHLADRLGARGVYVATLIGSSAAMAAFTAVHGFWGFLAVATLATCAQGAGLVARGPIINRYGGERPQRFRAYIRSVSNVGMSVGAALAGWVAQVDTRRAYVLLVGAIAVTWLLSAVIVLRVPAVPAQAVRRGPRWIALRDRPYLVLSLLDGMLSIQYRVMSVAIPLWLIQATAAPRWMISAIVLTNTFIVVFFQVRAGREVDTPRAGGRALRRSGVAFLVSCAVLSLASGVSAWLAAALLLAAAMVHSVGELWQAAGGFEISFELAPEHAQGQYLGVFGIGMGLADSIGPALLTTVCIGWGAPGWYLMGAIFLVTGLLVPSAVRWAERTRGQFAADRPAHATLDNVAR